MRKRKYCEFCCNATVEPELNHDNDFSSMSVGNTDDGFNMYLTTGYNRPTVIEVSMWNEKHKINNTIARYKMKYCPECGRKLIENER